MGRPRKTGMDYFPHDTDATNDKKIDAFRAHFGNDAYAFYFIILELIYRSPDAELDLSNPLMVSSVARRIMVTVKRFEKLLETALTLGLFSEKNFKSQKILTSNGIKQRANRVDELRDKWRNEKASGDSDTGVFREENPSIPRDTRPQSKSKSKEELKDIHTHKEIAQAPEPFAYEGSLDVWTAMQHYHIKLSGFLNFEKIRAFQGVMEDDLILAAIKESGGQADAYCLKILESWHHKGWHKLADHPKYRPTEGGDVFVMEVRRGRNPSQRDYQRNATASAFEEIRKRSKPGKQVYGQRE